MIMVDGKCFKAKLDGSIIEAKNSETIPFCNATTFIKTTSINLSCNNITDLKINFMNIKIITLKTYL